jgi:hypothetical protein
MIISPESPVCVQDAGADQYMRATVTLEDAESAFDEWGANCGPGALAAVLNKTLADVRTHIPLFDERRYTNPSMMFEALRSLKQRWKMLHDGWPTHGLCRVQWGGPWMKPGVPVKARYRHTHWIASRLEYGRVRIFDINAACVGWIWLSEWQGQLVPWLLKQIEPKNDGTWTITHRLELEP